VQYDLLVGVRRSVVVVGDVGLRLDVASVGRDAVAAAAAILAGGQLQAAAREPGEDAPQHPLEHLPALHRMEWTLGGVDWSGDPAMRAAWLIR
jgi:hypothetical protein